MRQCTLVLVFDEKDEILLCMKKRGFWVGKYNGAWWKVEDWETIAQGASRELFEETWVKISYEKLEKVWFFHFSFRNKPEWDQEVTLFISKNYSWKIEETEEMRPEWFNTNEIPFDKMWDDDKIWMPRILKWEKVEYSFLFDEDWKVLEYEKIM